MYKFKFAFYGISEGRNIVNICKDTRDLILEYVSRYYRYEKDFYRKNEISMADNNWQSFKQKDDYIENMQAKRVGAMFNDLFTSFEMSLMSKASMSYYYSDTKYKFSMTFPAYYDMFKKEILIELLNNMPEEVILEEGTLYDSKGNLLANSFLKLSLKSSKCEATGDYMIEMRLKNYSKNECPLGEEDKCIKWLKDNLKDIR